MKRHRLSLVVCLAFSLAGFAVCSSVAVAQDAPSVGGSSLLEGSLVVPGGFEEGQQAQAAEQAKLASPEAVVSREESQTKFENLDAEQAVKVAGEAFPAVIEDPNGGPPQLPEGQQITGYVNADTAQVDLGGGEHGLVQSFLPMALPTSSGGWAPVNLALSQSGNAFVPVNPLVAVRIPKRLGEGVQATASGLSLTPLGKNGASSAGSEGVVDGAAVLYANTQTDTDSLIKPTTGGFAADTLLRSVESPQQLSFRLGLPEGASLAQTEQGAGGVEVLKEGVAIARIPVPSARDAAGTAVPVSMSISGDTLTLSVADHSQEVQYPIDVDPEVQTMTYGVLEANRAWTYHETEGAGFTRQSGYYYVWMSKEGADSPGQRAEFYYKTDGDSKIDDVSVETNITPGAPDFGAEARVYLEYEGPGGYENSAVLASHENPIVYSAELCASAGCSQTAPGEHNLVRLADEVTGSANAANKAELTSATVAIAQPKETHSTVTYNTSSPEITYTSSGKEYKTPNAFYGGRTGWIGPNSGAIELMAKDSGIGVAKTTVAFNAFTPFYTKNYQDEGGACVGVQCLPEEREVLTYAQLQTVYEGEQLLRVSANDAFEHTSSSEHGEGEHEIGIDATPPHGIAVSGLPSSGEELELGEVEGHIKVEATDGEGSVKSSGIKSITVGIDGRELPKPSASCPLGPCTASGEVAVDGAELGVGTYTVTVVATDNAGNVASKNFLLHVYHASPVAMGPGSVNPESGDFALGATDVGLSGGAGTLAVTRHYDSRNPQEGEGGALGPQWTLSLGSLASLEVLPDGSVMVIGPEGLTHFNVKKGGGFEAPAGDANLKLEYETTNKEYLLKDAAKGTTTVFTLPSGATTWMPTISKGPVATDTVTDTYESVEPAATGYAVTSNPSNRPNSIVTGPDGKLWFTEKEAEKIGTVNTNGTGVTEYLLPGGELDPESITVGSDGNMWFYGGNSYLGKITPAGRLDDYLLPVKHSASSLAAGPDGDLWIADTEANTIEKINTEGTGRVEYPLPSESQPTGIATGPEGENALWFTEHGSSKIGKITTSGVVTEYALPSGSAPDGIATGPGGTVWFVEDGTKKVAKITRSGAITEYPLPAESEGSKSIVEGPEGNLWFTQHSLNKVDKITTSGVVTQYPLSSETGDPSGEPSRITPGPDGKMWFTEESPVGAIGTISTSTVVRPKLELAPHSSAACPAGEWEKWERACRGLEFVYAGKTKGGIGEKESEWGEYKGRLQEAKFVAYNPASKAMSREGVAKYEYDAKGRLRDEWNPEIAPALKTVYGYDAEGHVTALTPPGQESWAFTYGAIAGDPDTGRLLKVARAPASTILWKGEPPHSNEAPQLSGTAVVGVTISVSNGLWSSAPVSYAYQWEDCNTAGGACTPIPGATNPNYTVASSDVGHALVAEVTATNGGGSVLAASHPSIEVRIDAITEYSLPAESRPAGITAGSDGNLWFTDSGTDKVGKMTTSGVVQAEYATGGLQPEGITGGPEGDLWFVEHSEEKVDHITTAGELTVHRLPRASTFNIGIVTGPEKNLWFTESTQAAREVNGYVGAISAEDKVVGEYKLPADSEPYEIAVGTDKNLWFTEHGTSKIGKITPSGAITEYALPAESEPDGITAGPGSDLWFTESRANKVGKITTTGAITEYKLPSGSSPHDITEGPEGDLWFTDHGTSKISQMTSSGTTSEYSLPAGSGPGPITIGPDKNVWFVDQTTGKIGKLTINPTAGTKRAAAPGSTIEYNVPLSGSGLPNLTEGEAAKWGQKDIPAYATAIFAPDEPQSWPATSYKRATIDYLDSEARTVDVASPSGGIAAREYNQENAVTRSLSAENRAAAMGEGCASVAKKECKSEEVSELLDTKSDYDSEGQLAETWGPQHTVKLAVGKEGKKNEEALARNHVKYFYDEGAPEGETYDLVTKVIDGAETASKEEFDKRTATTSYSGQSNLGWKLREPTSETTEPGGVNLTTTTKYEESTGNVLETQAPAGVGGDKNVPPAYAAQFGKLGSEAGQLNAPRATAIATSGNVYVLDAANNRIDEYSPAGAFIETFGWGVSNGKAEFEVCKSSCKAGIVGSGNGQLKEPYAIAEDTKGNLWVADTGNDRIEEFNSKDEYAGQFGKEGAAGAQFKEPKGIAIAAGGAIYVTDGANARVQKFNEKGEFSAAYGFGVTNGKAEFEICTSSCKAGIAGSGNGQLNEPRGVAVAAGGAVWVADAGNNRLEEYKENGEYLTKLGTSGTGQLQFKEPKGLAIEPVSGNLWVADAGNNRLQELSAAGAYIATVGTKGTGNGQFEEPWGVAINTSGDMYVADVQNSRVQQWVPAITGNAAAHDTKSVYYTAKGEAEVEACREHPEWTGLPCETEPAAQPGVSGRPEIPVTKIAYNIWDQPETIEETFGSGTEAKKRTKKTTYEGAGRPVSSEVTSTIDEELPKVTDRYNKATGALEEQSTTVGATTKTITSKDNTLGQLETYTDAAGNTATFEYEKEKDMRLTKVSDAKGSQTYHYAETTGMLEKLVDSAAGTFTAEYNVAGKMTSESYPNGMTAYDTYNHAGEATGIEYKKTVDCAKSCPEVWFSDSVVPSIHGEALKQTSTLSEEPSYTYDGAGRLVEEQEVPAGEGCKTHLYSYDEDSNRTTETTREPATEGKCASEGGSTEWHTYDTANSLADPGVTYEPFGNTTKLPAADADGKESTESLTTEYYVDSQVYKQEQGEQKLEYKLDPAERTLETVSSGKPVDSTVVSHYDAAGGAVAWTGEGSGETEKWTRSIPGIDGALAATEKGEGKTSGTIVLLLHDLKGDVVGEAALSEAETKLLKSYNSTEFGVPSGKEAPPKYAWLGAAGVSGELPSGVITQDGVTYVPQTGLALQTEGVALPAPENAASPFTRAFEAWVGSKAGEGAARELSAAEQERQEREIANEPPGAIPSPEGGGGEEVGGGGEGGGRGGGGGCSGTHACAASVHHSRSCQAQVYVGEENGWVWSRAYMSCGGATMPGDAYLQACLIQEDGEGFSPIASGVGWQCGYAVTGEQYPHQLYAHYHEQCGLGGETVSFRGGLKYWMPGMGDAAFRQNKHGYECRDSVLVATYTFVWEEIEAFAPDGT
jgi:streptogramin lyase